MEKENEGYVVALNGFTKWGENTPPSDHTHYMSYRPRQDIGIRNPLYEHFLPSDFFSATQLRFAEIFPTKKDADKLISFLIKHPEILREKCLFYPKPQHELHVRVQKVALHINE